jgi:hypothetical protein
MPGRVRAIADDPLPDWARDPGGMAFPDWALTHTVPDLPGRQLKIWML